MVLIDVLLIEIIYFLAIASVCLAIFFRTRELYSLSKHPGIFHFRNIFLYFSLAFLARLFFIATVLLYEPRPMMHFGPNIMAFLVFGYFSTMAVLSTAAAALSRKISADRSALNNGMHITSIILSAFLFVTRTYDLLIIIQGLIFFFTVVMILLDKPRLSSLSGHNRLTYVLLFAFWLLNLFSSLREIPFELKAGLYLVSAGIFLSIYMKVSRRLVENVRQKK